jgi:DNA-binding NarL/FixJ family response regulator
VVIASGCLASVTSTVREVAPVTIAILVPELLMTHQLSFKAIASILDTEPSIGILGHAETFSQTIERVAALRPDVILFDLHMPDDNSFAPAFIRNQLAQSGARVLGMSLSRGEDEKNRGFSLRASARSPC